METSAFLEFIRLVVAGDLDRVSRRLSAAPALATTASPVGATRQQATDFFFTAISHYLYAGDTALHMAAAACSHPMAKLLMGETAEVLAEQYNISREEQDQYALCTQKRAEAAIQAGRLQDEIAATRHSTSQPPHSLVQWRSC